MTGLFLIFRLNRDAAIGILLLSLPLMGGVVAIAEIMRASIHEHFETLRSDMNGVAIIGIICAMSRRSHGPSADPNFTGRIPCDVLHHTFGPSHWLAGLKREYDVNIMRGLWRP